MAVEFFRLILGVAIAVFHRPIAATILAQDRELYFFMRSRGLREAGHLRPDITVDRAADIMWTYSSPELYELLVIRRGWPAERYGQFIAQALIAALLPGQGT